MHRVSRERLFTVSLSIAFGCAPVWGANRYRIDDHELFLGSGVNPIPVLGDFDQEVHAFSVSLVFDRSKLRVEAVRPGADVAPFAPEFSGGIIDNTNGDLSWGVVLSLSGESLTGLSPGAGKEMLELDVAVVATEEGTTVLDLANILGDPPRTNVLTGAGGTSLAPVLLLEDGTVRLLGTPPLLLAIEGNEGRSGDAFLVTGENLDKPGLKVEICGVYALFELLSASTLEVVAPRCGATGFAVLTICTDLGCAVEAEGFLYVEADHVTPFTRGDTNSDDRVDLSDGIGILNYLFVGIAPRAQCADALDSNDTGEVDLSDALYILNYLFQGNRPPPRPFPERGVDPTPDDLPEC